MAARLVSLALLLAAWYVGAHMAGRPLEAPPCARVEGSEPHAFTPPGRPVHCQLRVERAESELTNTIFVYQMCRQILREQIGEWNLRRLLNAENTQTARDASRRYP